jgi:hypothetical protein
MKSKAIAFWVATGIVGFSLVSGGIGDLFRFAPVEEGMTHLGYPPYVMTILGGWKLLAVLALLAPGYPRLKEWAYAGAFFDFSGAVASHLAAAEPLVKIIAPLLFATLTLVSWRLRPASRMLGAFRTSPAREAPQPRTAQAVAAG